MFSLRGVRLYAAAGNLREYVDKISGAALPIIREPDAAPGRIGVMLGRTDFGLAHVGDRLTRTALGYEGYILKTTASRLVLAGMAVPCNVVPVCSGDGTRHAVFDLLQRLGCRFFAFGEDGEHVPRRTTVSVAPLDVATRPDFVYRRMWYSYARFMPPETIEQFKSWCVKNRMGGPKYVHGHNYSRGGHAIIPGKRNEAMFASHPEYFPLITGEDGVKRRSMEGQLCLSNPDLPGLAMEAARRFMPIARGFPSFQLSPNDVKEGWCECDNCRAWDDPDPKVGLATRVLRFNNRVAEPFAREFHGRHILYYGEYNNMPGPPVRADGTVVIKAHPVVVPVCVNIYCLVHDINDPSCPRNVEYRRRLDDWQKVAEKLFMYEWFRWTTINPLPVYNVIGQRIRYYRDHGVEGYYGELLGHSPDNTLSMYIAARMLWDADQDPRELLNEFFDLFFQEAAEPMREYYRVLNEGVLNADSHGYRHMAFHPSRMPAKGGVTLPVDGPRAEQLRAILTAAVAAAETPVVRRRIERESKALHQYELEADIQMSVADLFAQPTASKAEALRSALAEERQYADAVSGIVNYGKSHLGWRNWIKQAIEKYEQ